MTDTWFLVGETPDKEFVVMRLDRATLPQANVVSGPWPSEQQALQVAIQMAKTGTA